MTGHRLDQRNETCFGTGEFDSYWNSVHSLIHSPTYPFHHSLTNSHIPLRWRHNGHDGVSNHQPHHCQLNHLARRRSKKTFKLRVTDLCVGNSPVTGEFPAQMASNAENVSIWWHHHALTLAFLSCSDGQWPGEGVLSPGDPSHEVNKSSRQCPPDHRLLYWKRSVQSMYHTIRKQYRVIEMDHAIWTPGFTNTY